MTTSNQSRDVRHASLLEAVDAALDGADPAEAAVVAVAIGAHVRDQELTAAAAASDAHGDGAGWTDRRWQYSDRLGRRDSRSIRIPVDAPADPWTAAGRADRM